MPKLSAADRERLAELVGADEQPRPHKLGDYERDLAWVRWPAALLWGHAATGSAPLGSNADERMAAAVRNWEQAVANAHRGAS